MASGADQKIGWRQVSKIGKTQAVREIWNGLKSALNEEIASRSSVSTLCQKHIKVDKILIAIKALIYEREVPVIS